MLVIRLRRAGSKGSPFFRIVVSEDSAARDGRFVEIIGHYNPRTTPETCVVNRERMDHWIGVGAKASDTVRTLVARMPPPAEVAAGEPEPTALAAAPEESPAPPVPETPAADEGTAPTEAPTS